MARNETSIEVTRVIDASAKDIFEVLSNPERHAEIDNTGTVVSDEKSDRISGTGDTFTMNMNAESQGGDYKMVNTVVGFDENKLIAWQPAPEGQEPGGWTWRYTLNSLGESSTEVTLSYDWSHVSDPELASIFPAFEEEELEGSLGNLAAAVSS